MKKGRKTFPPRRELPSPPQAQSWVIAALLAILLGSLYLQQHINTVTISEHKFEQMMLRGDVQEVVLIINKNKVEAKLKPEALEKAV
ncbi:MAG: peptidase M41, partial [Bacteroidota bacterium]